MIAHLDTNEDGVLSLEEFTTRPREMFSRIDSNGDGIIDESEREAMRGQMRERHGDRPHGPRFGENDRGERGPRPE